MTKTEQSLYDCLQYCKIANLPESWDKKSVWITSICRVLKNDGNQYYVYCERDKEAKTKVVKDFGACRAIVEMQEYFPLIYLNTSYVRKFPKSDEGNANLIGYLTSNGMYEAESTSNRKELDKMNIRLAIQKQLAEEKRKSKIIIKY